MTKSLWGGPQNGPLFPQKCCAPHYGGDIHRSARYAGKHPKIRKTLSENPNKGGGKTPLKGPNPTPESSPNGGTPWTREPPQEGRVLPPHRKEGSAKESPKKITLRERGPKERRKKDSNNQKTVKTNGPTITLERLTMGKSPYGPNNGKMSSKGQNKGKNQEGNPRPIPQEKFGDQRRKLKVPPGALERNKGNKRTGAPNPRN